VTVGGNRLNRKGKINTLLLITISFIFSGGLMKTAFADVPRVDNVIVWSSGGDTILNVTVTHNDRSAIHYVDQIEVGYGLITKYFNFTSQASTSFTVVCNLGPVEDAPTATVKAHCNTHGWSTQNWTGQIPEFSLTLAILTLIIATLLASLAYYKNNRKTCQ
jgi:hypothetical protein